MKRYNLSNKAKGAYLSGLLMILSLALVTSLAGLGLNSLSDTTTVYADSTDSIYSWGSFLSQSGSGNENNTPAIINNLSNIVKVQAGNASYMALDSSGNVWTWGLGANGVLGDGSSKNQLTAAVEVQGLPKIVSIGEADNTDVALDSSGNVWGWGWNEGGQLCQGNTIQHDTPIELSKISGVAAVAGGGKHMLYLMSDGTVEACGSNKMGGLGDGSPNNSEVPVNVVGLPSSVAAISAGPSFSTALLTNGQVWAWGANQWGQLGNGTQINSDVPVQVKLSTPAVQIYSGGDTAKNGQSLALLTNGQVWGWGNNQWGQLGNGTKQNTSLPVQATNLPSGTTITYVASGGAHSLALDSEGNVWAWGDNAAIGMGSKSKVLTPIEVLSNADMISATANDSIVHSLAPAS